MELKKNKKYELEPKRPLFFGVGMIIALSLTIVAFEWKSPISPVVGIPEPEDDIVFVMDEVKITRHIIPEIPKPKPQVKKQVRLPLDRVEIKEVKEIMDPQPIDVGSIDDVIDETISETSSPEPVVTEFLIVENMPEFPGGDAALLGFLAKNIRYPRQAKRMGIEGKVHLQFIVDVDGSITDIEVLKGIGAGCDEEAIRVMKLLPNYSPGKQRGVPVRVRMQVPINFQLK